MKNQDYAKAYFKPTADLRRHECLICGTERAQAPNSGYANLMSHLDGFHPGYKDKFVPSGSTLDSYMRRGQSIPYSK